MNAVFMRTSRSSVLVATSLLVALPALSTPGLCAQQDDPDRPRISHQSNPIPQTDPPIDPLGGFPANVPPKTPIGEGLVLLSFGHVWARDIFDGQPQLVQLKFVPTEIDRHAVSNLLKANMAPFVYKPKESIEIEGPAAKVRLHDPHANIYIRALGYPSEDAASSSETSTRTDLTLVRAEPRKDRRILSTVAFTQITARAVRSNETIAFTIERVGNTDWRKITPNAPLLPGEYALLLMPRGQNLFAANVFDFAVDPKAPANTSVVTPAADTQSRQ